MWPKKNLTQCHVVCQVAAPYSVWQRFSLCRIESNVNKNFKVIQNPGFLPDHPQHWITGSFCHSQHSQIISERSSITFWVILLTHRQTNKLWQKHNLLGGGNQTSRSIPKHFYFTDFTYTRSYVLFSYLQLCHNYRSTRIVWTDSVIKTQTMRTYANSWNMECAHHVATRQTWTAGKWDGKISLRYTRIGWNAMDCIRRDAWL